MCSPGLSAGGPVNGWPNSCPGTGAPTPPRRLSPSPRNCYVGPALRLHLAEYVSIFSQRGIVDGSGEVERGKPGPRTSALSKLVLGWFVRKFLPEARRRVS